MTEKLEDIKRFTVLKRTCVAEGEMLYHLQVFGDTLAQREKYKEHRDIDAIHYYLCQKFKWTPAVVRSLNPEEMNFLLKEEMHGWTVPKEARLS